METATNPRKEVPNLRPANAEDADVLGSICYEAFRSIAERHNFPPDFPSPEIASGLMSMMISRPDVYSVVAVDGERILGSNFLWESDSVAGVGPITVDPGSQNSSVGRTLMSDVLERAKQSGAVSVRLVQAAYHNRSLSLYTKLGFDTVEPLTNIGGEALRLTIDGYLVRPMSETDLPAVDDLCARVHGHIRHNEAAAAIQTGTAVVVEHNGRITGYSTGVGFFGHTVGESNRDIQAIIGSAPEFSGPGFLLPTRNSELMRWCFEHGLKAIQPLTLMARGLYQEPRGSFLPSILY